MATPKIATTTEYPIDKGVPVPTIAGRGKWSKYPWAAMEVGDSFFICGKTARQFPAAGSATKRYAPKKFTTRTVTEDGVTGTRIWRTA